MPICYRNGCGPYEHISCSECPASRPEYMALDKMINLYDLQFDLIGTMKSLGYLTVPETAKRWGVTDGAVRALIKRKRISNMFSFGEANHKWNFISVKEPKPKDARKKENRV